jgi:hypothetical protein
MVVEYWMPFKAFYKKEKNDTNSPRYVVHSPSKLRV